MKQYPECPKPFKYDNPNYRQRQSNPNPDWQGWPLEQRKSDWLDHHTGKLIGLIIVVGSAFSFICGVVVGIVQPPLYRWIIGLLGLGG